MASIKITRSKKGELQAKIQAVGKNISTGEKKFFTKRVYNTDNLTEAKFKKFVDKAALAFEEEIATAYVQEVQIKPRVLTFNELMQEWKATVRANYSQCYLQRIEDLEIKFTAFLKEHGLFDKPISAITVRDIQLFLNSFAEKTYIAGSNRSVKLKRPLPKTVSFRELARAGIVSRNTSYYMNNYDTAISIEKAHKICDYYGLRLEDYFSLPSKERKYSKETVKGYRRMLRTLFNEAMRYEWITSNPVCKTKIGAAGSGNACLRPVPEKEVFSFTEVRDFLAALDTLIGDSINYRVCIKTLLFTGVRIGELCGLRWSDIDFTKRLIHVRRNRLYSKDIGIYEKEPKTKTSIRDIPMPSVLREELLRYQEWFRLADDNFDNRLNEYYLASGIDRQPLHPMTMRHVLGRIEEKFGFKRVTCHGLRHTYCSLLLSQNVPIQTVSRYMGHADSTTTLKIYSHFIPDTQEVAVNALDNISKKDDDE